MSSQNLINQLSQPFYDENGNANERLTKYCSRDVHKIVIDRNEFTGYKTYSFFWEKTYVKEPERSASGVIGNLNSYATFITPHLQINFALISAEDYRRLYNLILARNEFSVTCYDPLTNDTTTNNMYFHPDTLPKLVFLGRTILNPTTNEKEKWVELLGAQDYTVEMVGTNTSLDNVIVQYYANNPAGTTPTLSDVAVDVVVGQDIIIGRGAENIMNTEISSTEGRFIFKEWNTAIDGSGTAYLRNNTLNIAGDVQLYAQWVQKESYTLSYNYGLGSAEIGENGEPIYRKQVKYNESYGALYVSPDPTVTFLGNTYPPYERKGWYKTPIIGEDSTALVDNGTYDIQGNATFYQIYEPKSFTITFDSKGGSEVSEISNTYGTKVTVPTPTKDGKTFGGWYFDDDYENRFNNTIPPTNVTLYAKWQ